MSESSTTPHENPVTGERITFHKTSRDTGEYVLIEAAVAPGGGVASHVHPYPDRGVRDPERLGRVPMEAPCVFQ